MVIYRMEMTDELLDAAADIAVGSAENKRRRRRATIFLGVAAAVALGSGLLLMLRSDADGLALLFFGMVCIAVIALLKRLQLVMVKRMTKRAEAKVDEPFRSGAVEYAFTDEGVSIVSRTGRGLSPWDAFRAFGETTAHLYLIRGDNRMILVQKDALQDTELDELRKLCARHLPAA